MRFSSAALFAVVAGSAQGNSGITNGVKNYFNRVASFPICSQIEPNFCNDDTTESVAEIVAASQDGNMVIYTDSQYEAVGFVDITDPSNPVGAGVIPVGGEPTSVATCGNYAIAVINTSQDYIDTSGKYLVISMSTKTIVREGDLSGQPDAVTFSKDCTRAAVAIENERDEDLGNGEPPQMPPGTVVIIDTSEQDPLLWATSDVNVTGLDGVLFPEDPEPEFVSINSEGIVAVTLQENNAIVLIDTKTYEVVGSFTAGTVNLTQVDLTEEGVISQTETDLTVPREPDGITWLDNDYFATADEGDLYGGSRGFTVFHKDGSVVYSSGNELEHLAASVGHYPEQRSGNKGNEPENVAFGVYGNDELLFVNSERSNIVFVYNVKDTRNPKIVQILPAGVGPEGACTIPERDLLVVASEVDRREDNFRSVINIYQRGLSHTPSYPTLVSRNRIDGTPIPWASLSGLAADGEFSLYAVEDSFFRSSRIFKISTNQFPAVLEEEIFIQDTNGLLASLAAFGEGEDEFSEEDIAALVNEDGTVNLDLEGIAMAEDGGFWVVSEGSGTVGGQDRPVKSINLLLKVASNGGITDVITLPSDVNAFQRRFGFHGVAAYGDKIIVGFQRAWGSEAHPRLGIYKPSDKSWDFVFYPLDTATRGWTGIGDISSLGGNQFLVLERDNQGGPDAVIKKLYKIDLKNYNSGSTVQKELIRDLIPDLEAQGGLINEKVEGLAVTLDGEVWVVNDNDGVDNHSGETQLINLGKLFDREAVPVPAPVPAPPPVDDTSTKEPASRLASFICRFNIFKRLLRLCDS